MSTVFHKVFPDSFQGKYIIQSHLRLIVLLIDIVRRPQPGRPASFGFQLQSPQLVRSSIFGLFIVYSSA